MKQIKSFLQKLTKKHSESSEVMEPKQGNSPVDQGETPPSEKVSDAPVERGLYKELFERVDSIIVLACDYVEKELILPDVTKYCRLEFNYDDFPDTFNAELVLVGKVAECVSDWMQLTKEQKQELVYLTKLKKIAEVEENGTVDTTAGYDCNWREPLDGSAVILDEERQKSLSASTQLEEAATTAGYDCNWREPLDGSAVILDEEEQKSLSASTQLEEAAEVVEASSLYSERVDSMIVLACDYVEKELQLPDVTKYCRLEFNYHDFPDNFNAELVLVGKVAECVSDWMQLTKKQKQELVYLTKLKKLAEVEKNGTVDTTAGYDCNWREPLDGSAVILDEEKQKSLSASTQLEEDAEVVKASSVYSEHCSDVQVDEPGLTACTPPQGDKFKWSSRWKKFHLFVKKSDAPDAKTGTTFKDKVAKVWKKKEKVDTSDARAEITFKDKFAKVWRKKEKIDTSDARTETSFKEKVAKVWKKKEMSHTNYGRSVPDLTAQTEYLTRVRDESDDDLCEDSTDPTNGSSKQVSKVGPFDKLTSKVKNLVSDFKKKRHKLHKISL